MRIIDGTFNRINISTVWTSFLLNIQCERQGGRTYFDGLFGTNININLRGTSMFAVQLIKKYTLNILFSKQ
jgi:hypothetical protein